MIHAGNASQISDGSAALLIMTGEKAAELGLTPLARVHTAVLAGADPVIMLTAPIPATEKALQALRPDDRRHRRLRGQRGVRAGAAGLAGGDRRRREGLNPHGGAIALGHPLGGSGARIMTTHALPHARQRHPLRPADHVRGRRPGQRHHPRAAVTADPQAEAPCRSHRATGQRSPHHAESTRRAQRRQRRGEHGVGDALQRRSTTPRSVRSSSQARATIVLCRSRPQGHLPPARTFSTPSTPSGVSPGTCSTSSTSRPSRRSTAPRWAGGPSSPSRATWSSPRSARSSGCPR